MAKKKLKVMPHKKKGILKTNKRVPEDQEEEEEEQCVQRQRSGE
jgi:hypothetical protein